MSANVGEELRPIQKIASGGELARIMLAMKNVFSQQEKLGTMVFDEVDTGVSGRAAQKVAEEDGKNFPPEAGAVCDASSAAGSYGGYSFFCRKGRFRRPDFTRVQELTRQQRREELARPPAAGRLLRL